MERHLHDIFAAIGNAIRTTLRTELSSIWLPIQLGAIGAAALAAFATASILRRRFDFVSATMGWPSYLRLAARALIDNFGFLIFILLLLVIRAVIEATADHPRTYLLTVATNLATAWVVIEILTSLIRNHLLNRIVAITAWAIAALSITGLLEPTVAALDSRGIVLGGLRITPLLVLKTTALLLLALWAAAALSNFVERRVQEVGELTPSLKVLVAKLARIAIMTLAIVVVLSSAGIDLSVLAVLGGAIGVGIGLGLQKIVSNFVSGVVLLADKSIKPGDVISVGDHFGIVTTMGARFTSVDARDGREYLIPNEEFVTQRVVNWSYTSNLVRIEVKFSVTYGTDPRKVQATASAAAIQVPRVLSKPAPVCHIMAFAAAAVEYEMWFWINDPTVGVANVRSAVLLSLWETFEREGIAIPKPGATRVILEQPSR